MSSRMDKHNTKKKRKWPKWVAGILIICLLATGGFLYYLYDKIGDTVSHMYDPLNRDEDPNRQKDLDSILKQKDAVNLLLLGVDEREGDKGRSDTMILMSLHPKTDSMLMLSIPRDTYVDIPDYGMDKINHAYAFGDVGLAVQTVENTFDLPVHYYAKVNMEGFVQGIDALGGVNVHNETAFSQGGADFSSGDIHLDGKNALKYIRMRKNDPRGDMGRNERQREVIKAAMNEASSFSSISKVSNILNILGNNATTNLDMDRLKALFSDYRGTRKNIKTIELEGTGETIDRWYYMVTDDEFSRVTNEFRTFMEAS